MSLMRRLFVSVPHTMDTEPPTSGGESTGSALDVVLREAREDTRLHALCPRCYGCLGNGALAVGFCGAFALVHTVAPTGAVHCDDCLVTLSTINECPLCGQGINA
jgi:hypothetical protein